MDNICWIYDDNQITIEGSTELAFSEDVATRFRGLGWQVVKVADANDLGALAAAYTAFLACADRPTLLMIHSVIGYGSPHKAGKASCAWRTDWRGGNRSDQGGLWLAGRREVPRPGGRDGPL